MLSVESEPRNGGEGDGDCEGSMVKSGGVLPHLWRSMTGVGMGVALAEVVPLPLASSCTTFFIDKHYI
jgi:hypothetical protein